MDDRSSNPGCLGRVLQLLSAAGGTEAAKRSKEADSGEASEVPWPYRRKKYLLSQAEFSFFRVLQSVAAESGWVVCPKVNLNDLLYLAKGTQSRQRWFNKINRKHADFVLCDAETMCPVAVVELDDASHQSASAQKRDATKDRALASAGLPLIRVRAQRGYQLEALRLQISAAISGVRS